MSDVRLTATNPEDSSVVPVACNAKGELLLEEPIAPPEFDGNLDGDLTVSGSATFAGNGTFAKTILVNTDLANDLLYGVIAVSGSDKNEPLHSTFWAHNVNAGGNAFAAVAHDNNAKQTVVLRENGTAVFKGDVVVGSRGRDYMLVEQGGLCHMVEQNRPSTLDLVEPAAATEYPQLRDVFAELNVIEKALEEVMEKLRMTQPDGWPVWDGSDNS